MNDPRKQSMYLETSTIKEIRVEAERQQRTLSWLVQRAWLLAREDLKKLRVADQEPWP